MRMKLCISCAHTGPKSVEEFHYKNKVKGTRQDRCMSCAKAYAKTHYEKNKEHRLEQINERQNQVRLENRKAYADFISSKKCSICGEDDARCLTSTVSNDDILYKSPMTLEAMMKLAVVKCLNCDAKTDNSSPNVIE